MMGIEPKGDCAIGTLTDLLQGPAHSVRHCGTTLQGIREYLSEFWQPAEPERLNRPDHRRIRGARALCQLSRRTGESDHAVTVDEAENAKRCAPEPLAAFA